jgi:hypothetical protein
MATVMRARKLGGVNPWRDPDRMAGGNVTQPHKDLRIPVRAPPGAILCPDNRICGRIVHLYIPEGCAAQVGPFEVGVGDVRAIE